MNNTTRFILMVVIAVVCIFLFSRVNASNYEWLKESLQPVSNCQGVTGAIVHEAVYLNVLCPEHGPNGELVWAEKSIYIDLIAKTWRRDNGRFELLSSK